MDERGASWVGSTEFVGIVDIACGLLHNVGLKRNGTVVAFGANDCGQCDVADWKTLKRYMLACRNYKTKEWIQGVPHICSVHFDYSLLDSLLGFVPEGAYNDAVALMDAGKYYEAAVTFYSIRHYKDAKAQSFAIWNQIAKRESLAAGNGYTVGQKSDGTVVAVGENENGQCNVTEWKDLKVPNN